MVREKIDLFHRDVDALGIASAVVEGLHQVVELVQIDLGEIPHPGFLRSLSHDRNHLVAILGSTLPVIRTLYLDPLEVLGQFSIHHSVEIINILA